MRRSLAGESQAVAVPVGLYGQHASKPCIQAREDDLDTAKQRAGHSSQVGNDGNEGLSSLETQKSYPTAKFRLGEQTGNKADPAAVARSMQCGLCGYDKDLGGSTEAVYK